MGNKSFKFSIVMAVYNVEDYLDESIQSILNQTLKFEDYIQLILVNDGSVDNSLEIALKYQKRYPDNIIVLNKDNGGVSSARNLGLEHATGEYINFMDSDDLISRNTIKDVYKFFLKYPSDDYDLVSIPVEFFEIWDGDHFLNNRFEESKSNFVDLTENPTYYQLFTHSIFVKKDAIGDLKFDTKLIHMEDSLFVNKLLLNKPRYGLVKSGRYYYRKRYVESSLNNLGRLKKEYYVNRFEYLYMELINDSIDKYGKVLDFIQNIIIYDMHWFMKSKSFVENINEAFVDKQKIDKFYLKLEEICFFLSDENILSNDIIPDYIRSFFIYFKNDDFHIETDKKKVYLKSNDVVLNRLDKHKLWIDIVDLKRGFLYITGTYSSLCDWRFIRIEAIKESKGKKTVFKSKYYDYVKTYRQTRKVFSIPWKFYYNFDFKIPIDKNETCKIHFKIVYEENDTKVSMKGRLEFREYSDLTRESYYSVRDNQILLVRFNTFYIEDYTFVKRLKNEARTILNILNDRSVYFINAIFYRIMYLLIYVFMKNRDIWILMDRPNQSGDNGEHLYHYVANQNDGIEKYFIIDKGTDDYKRLKKQYGYKILSFGSMKHKLLYFYANKVISSHPDYQFLNPFDEKGQEYYSGLITSDIYFLQHGIPKYAMQDWLRKFDHNLSLIVAVSELDYNSYLEYYNFEEDVIQILGYPRYDNLTNENMQRKIVILFSWRNFIKTDKILLSSEYYQRLNSLINNKKLINYANDKGYEIVFKMHPRIAEYLNLFDKNENIIFDDVTKYHDIICDCALMITDYSSVAFDFAYLKKPVIYYQYGDDYHFDVETNYFDEEKSGFGEIIKDEDKLVEKVIEYIDNDCTMEDKFRDNVDAFFKYHDKNNSKRCYEWIKSH